LAYFNLDDNTHTRITFYCRVQNNGVTDTVAPVFTYTSDPHANIIKRTPANEYLANVSNGTDNDEKLYIQSAPGSYATVKIPALSALPNMIVHRAELIFDKYPSNDDVFAVPQSLFVDAINARGDSAFTIRNDFVPANTITGFDPTTFGGNFRNNQYTVLLTRYVQSIVTKGFPNYTLRVYAPFTAQPYYMQPNSNTLAGQLRLVLNTPVAAGRVVLYGGAAAEPKRVRLRIIYSRI
jgi:hypothetical protein